MITIHVPKQAHAPALHAEIGAALPGDKLKGVSSVSAGTVTRDGVREETEAFTVILLDDAATSDDIALVHATVNKHKAAPPPTPPTLEEQLAAALRRIDALEKKAK